MISATSNPVERLVPDTLLRLASPLNVRFAEGEEVRLEWAGQKLTIAPVSLVLLEVFSRPRTLHEASAQLKARCSGAQGWMDLTGEILRWHREGALVSGTGQFQFGKKSEAYDAPSVHVRMLNDRNRTGGFLQAIREIVKRGDVVLDIGTGTGVLATAAAQAGARRVFAVEASGILGAARQVFRSNGFAETIEPVEGWSTESTVSEPADVLISEMIGSEPLEEHILEITLDARRRLLKPNPRLCPSVIEIWALPVLVPEAELDQRFFTERTVNRWTASYGIDFGILSELSRNHPTKFLVQPDRAKGWPTACDGVRVSRIDLATFETTAMEMSASALCQRPGTINAVMTFFRAELSPGNWISTHPLEAGPWNHWDNTVRLLRNPIQVAPGHAIEFRYHYRNPEREPHEMELIALEAPH